jgi:uncharacterized membrane protein YgdD (TMEM256/DUF423 family)
MQRCFGIIACLFGLTAVILGAFGTHALRGVIPDASFAIFQTGVQYQFYHALALLGIAALSVQREHLPLRIAGWALVVGIVFFSGSLYLITLAGLRIFGAVAPIGGFALMVGWSALAISFWRKA